MRINHRRSILSEKESDTDYVLNNLRTAVQLLDEAQRPTVPLFDLGSLTILEHDTGGTDQPYCCDLWRVKGIPGRLFPTKITAEAAAALYFPDDANRGYSRLSFVTFSAW